MKTTIIGLAAALVVSLAADSQAADSPAAAAGPVPAANQPWLANRLAPALEEETGLKIHGVWHGTYYQNLEGGVSTAAAGCPSTYADIEALWDLTKARMIPGGTLGLKFFGVAGPHDEDPLGGRAPREVTTTGGSESPVSYLTSEDMVRMVSLWYRQEFLDQRAWVKFGKFNYYDDLASSTVAGKFLSADFVWLTSTWSYREKPNIVNYPNTPLGALAGAKVGGGLSLQAAAFLNNSDSYTVFGLSNPEFDQSKGGSYIVEARWQGELFAGLKTDARLGGWRDDEQETWVDTLGTKKVMHGVYGAYAIVDQEWYREGTMVISSFAQVSVSDHAKSQIPRQWGVGLVAAGLVASRPDDAVGIGAANCTFNRPARGEWPVNETVFEVFYSCQVRPWLLVKPFLQCTLHPAWAVEQGGAGHAVGGGIEATATF